MKVNLKCAECGKKFVQVIEDDAEYDPADPQNVDCPDCGSTNLVQEGKRC